MSEQQAVLDFWFPDGVDADLETHKNYWMWRMRGGADESIVERFSDLTARAAAGEFDDWAKTPRGRLALIVVLDQFSRSVWRNSPKAFAQDEKALALTLEGLDNGHFDALANVWEKTFFGLPLGHCEGPDLLDRIDRCIALGDKMIEEAPAHLRPMYEFSAQQPREHRRVIVAFGRHPHRNEVLGRESTPEELTYIAEGKFPHQRDLDI